jgi:hypothetical protein
MKASDDRAQQVWVQVELRRALYMLASSFEQQVAWVPANTCLACELASDVKTFGAAFLGNRVGLTAAQRDSLEGLLAWLDILEESSDYRCWDQASVRDGPGWQRARELARLALTGLNL